MAVNMDYEKDGPNNSAEQVAHTSAGEDHTIVVVRICRLTQNY